MSQTVFSSIDPAISGTTLATTLNNFKDALMSGLSGTSRPAQTLSGGSWVDTTNDPTSWAFKIWTGTTDITIFTLNLTTGVGSVALAVDSFQIKKVSADTVGAIMSLIKQRITSNGQVHSGDVVGEIHAVGRTNTSTNPVVAKIVFTATDDMTTSASGGTLSFYSTPDGTATITEHMRFINGLVETVVPHKLNSQILVPQNVATTATIAALDGSKILVEMTGSTATSIQGINAAQDSQTVTVHNRSSAAVTLKHQDSGASAANRLKLPNSADYIIPADGTATLYYCTTDIRWKLLSTSQTSQASGLTIDRYFGVTQTWTAPSTTSEVAIRSYRSQPGLATERPGMLDYYQFAFAWGANLNGQLGLGDVTPRSSPVAVLEALQFNRVYGVNGTDGVSMFGLKSTGDAMAWGINAHSQLGVAADVIPRSSPVAVLGGLKFAALYPRDTICLGLTSGDQLFAWGGNANGQLGIGSVTLTSSPVAVLGSLKFSKVIATSGSANAAAVLALTTAGVAYCWGINTNGNLGVGDVTPRSSPVAVLGSLTLADIKGAGVSSRYFGVGLTTAGALYGWGANTSGQLGLGDQTVRSSPVAVLGGLTFNRLILHEKSESVMALTSGGTLYSWGDNTQGVLGLGDSNARSSPVAVLGGLTFAKVAIYKSTAFGLAADGTLYMWGANAAGQLGVGDVVARSSPVAVLGGLKFSDVTFADGPTDDYSVFATTPDGLVWSWGSNTNGTLGLGDVTKRSSPVAVLGAFAADPRETIQTTYLTVIPGGSYTIGTGPGNSSFGQACVGRDVYKIEVEYLQ